MSWPTSQGTYPSVPGEYCIWWGNSGLYNIKLSGFEYVRDTECTSMPDSPSRWREYSPRSPLSHDSFPSLLLREGEANHLTGESGGGSPSHLGSSMRKGACSSRPWVFLAGPPSRAGPGPATQVFHPGSVISNVVSNYSQPGRHLPLFCKEPPSPLAFLISFSALFCPAVAMTLINSLHVCLTRLLFIFCASSWNVSCRTFVNMRTIHWSS